MKKQLLFVLFSFLLEAAPIENPSYLEGKKLYEEACISCHGEYGEGKSSMHLTVKPRRLSESILTQAQMFQVIYDGGHAWGAHSDIMASYKYLYTKEEIENMSLYIFTTFNAGRDERVEKLLQDSSAKVVDATKMLQMGEKIFKKRCTLCHGITGNGQGAYVQASKKNREFLYPYDLRKILLDENQIFLYVKYGGHFWGNDGAYMPSWKAIYNDTQLRGVSHYVNTKIKKSHE